MNDTERENWVMNDEGLYNAWKRSGLSMRNYLRRNRADTDSYIKPVAEGTKPAHHGAPRRLIITEELTMKRIIEGRAYNTETATKVCGLDCNYYPGDFQYHHTVLYRTAKGQFFIAGSGGALSMWARAQGDNSRGWGEGIRLVDNEEARRIMEDNGCDEEDFKRFGLDVQEG